ncbi:helix-turn-helix domain-containing protein [Blastococcus brunescens]
MVHCVERAFDLLERIAAHSDGARLSDLADGVGLPATPHTTCSSRSRH